MHNRPMCAKFVKKFAIRMENELRGCNWARILSSDNVNVPKRLIILPGRWNLNGKCLHRHFKHALLSVSTKILSLTFEAILRRW